jgi:Tfp pilus assembly ATPase PilU
MHQAGGSDLFLSNDFPPSMKLRGTMKPLTDQKISGEITRQLAEALMNDKQRKEFTRELECNFAISVPGVARLRVNVFQQQQQVGMVIRTIANIIRTSDGKGRRAGVEILLNTPIVQDKLLKGEFHEIKSIMTKSQELGMRTFDASLLELHMSGAIDFDEAIRNADSANELRLSIKLSAKQKTESATQMSRGLTLEPAPDEDAAA